MKLEEQLQGFAQRVRTEAKAPQSIPPHVVRRIRLRQVAVTVFALSLIGVLTAGGIVALQTGLGGGSDTRISTAQGGDSPEIITTVEIEDQTDMIRISKDDPDLPARGRGDTFLVALLGPDHLDSWGLASFPLEDDLEHKVRSGAAAGESPATKEWAIYGAVSERVAEVTAHLSDGRVVKGELFQIPERFATSGQVFVMKMAPPSVGGEIVVVDGAGTLLESETIPVPDEDPLGPD